MSIYIGMVVSHTKQTRNNYVQYARWLVASLLRVNFPEENIFIISNRDSLIQQIESTYKKISYFLVPFSTNRKGWFFKPVAYSEAVPRAFRMATKMVMCDVDMLFYKDPTPFFLKSTTDVWVRGRERYLRPSRIKKMPKKFQNPRLDNFKELAGYMGETKAYLFLKYKMTNLPEKGLYSDLISFSSQSYDRVIPLWRQMFEEIMKTKHIQGDQEILDAAVRHLGLSVEYGVEQEDPVSFVGDFNWERKKTLLPSKVKELGLPN